jgi:hypothetical protein
MNHKFLFEILATFGLDIYIFGRYSRLVALVIIIAWFAWNIITADCEEEE